VLTEQYLYKKVIDWSVLNYGINIPVSLQLLFYNSVNYRMRKGEKRKITIIVDGINYDANLTNIHFDEKKYPTHKELLQIRYNPNSPLAKKMREVFLGSYNWLSSERIKRGNIRKQLNVPEDMAEYVAIYSTPSNDIFMFDCITYNEIFEAKQIVSKYDEMELEAILNMKDNSSAFIEKDKTVKIRKLDNEIGNCLKRMYEYRCQVCSEFIGNKYSATVIHSHHIEPFSLTLNNDPDNIMIICPNHHGIVHAAKPIFNRQSKRFEYQNGYIEKLMINLHL